MKKKAEKHDGKGAKRKVTVKEAAAGYEVGSCIWEEVGRVMVDVEMLQWIGSRLGVELLRKFMELPQPGYCH